MLRLMLKSCCAVIQCLNIDTSEYLLTIDKQKNECSNGQKIIATSGIDEDATITSMFPHISVKSLAIHFVRVLLPAQLTPPGCCMVGGSKLWSLLGAVNELPSQTQQRQHAVANQFVCQVLLCFSKKKKKKGTRVQTEIQKLFYCTVFTIPKNVFIFKWINVIIFQTM